MLATPGLVAATSITPQTTSSTGLVGRIRDVLSGRPIEGAEVTVPSRGLATTSDAYGQYTLTIPPGSYLIHISANGFITAILPDIGVSDGYRALDGALVPHVTSAADQRAIYQKVVRQIDVPLVAVPPSQTSVSPANVSVPSTITIYYDKSNPPQMVQVPLEDYVKGVVPNEVPASWPAETLKAQAVASRSYGVATSAARGYVYPDSRSQVYDPTKRTAPTDAAVDATAGQVLVYGGSIITAFFFSECNGITTKNSENALSFTLNPSGGPETCGSLGWNYVAYCRARSCTGHNPSNFSTCGYAGHGVGMCQWGSYYRGLSGTGYLTILNAYYTGVSLNVTPLGTPTPTGPYLVRAAQAFTLTWASAGGGVSYNVTIYPAGSASPVFSAPTGNTSIGVGGLAAGAYTWTVTAGLNGQTTSASANLHAANQILKVYLPTVSEK